MSQDGHFSYEEKRGFGARYGFVIGIVAVVAVAALLFSTMFSAHSPPPRKAQEMVMIKPVNTPPPPPPPPPQNIPKPQEQQTQVTEQDLKQDEQPPEDPTPSLGTGLTGNGPADGFGLGGRDKGYINGNGGGGTGGGSRFGGYFTSVKQAVKDALGRHPATRNASFDIRVRVWSDSTGRVNRVKLVTSTGDAALDDAISTKALAGCQLPDLPEGMKMPIELRLNLRRPN